MIRFSAVVALISFFPATAVWPTDSFTLIPRTTVGGSYYGWGLSALDDVTGDGVNDIIVGSLYGRDPGSGTNSDGAGRAYVFNGVTGERLYELNAPKPERGGQFGKAVTNVPDINGDGLSEIAVATDEMPRSGGRNQFGQIFLFDGRYGDHLRTIESPEDIARAGFGESVLGIPDVNGDGAGDLVAGAEGHGDYGLAYIFSGKTGEVLNVLHSRADRPGYEFGYSLSWLRDLTGDGLPEVLVGAYRDRIPGGPQGVGRVHLYNGATGQFLRSFQSPEPQDGAAFGFSVSGVHDTNGNGFDDVLVGSPWIDQDSTYSDIGGAFLFDGMTGELLASIEPPHPQDKAYFGYSVSGVPDADGDGRGDLSIGSPYTKFGPIFDQGRPYLYSGATGNLLQGFVVPNVFALGRLGYRVAGLEDVNGDGLGDFVASSPLGSLGYAATVFLSPFEPPSMRYNPEQLSFPEVQLSEGISPHQEILIENNGLGDLCYQGSRVQIEGRDADEFVLLDGEEVLPIPASGEHTIRVGFNPVTLGEKEARLAIYSNDADQPDVQIPLQGVGIPSATQASFHSQLLLTDRLEEGGWFGRSAAGVPDFTGDGFGDVVVTSRHFVEDDPPLNRGRAFLFNGRTGQQVRILDTPDPDVEDGHFGYQCSGVPDTNGDGYGNVLVGAPEESPGEAPDDAGRVYLFSGFDGEFLYTFVSPNEGMDRYFGAAVSGSPDMNGDRRGEVLIGEPGEDSTGKAYIFDGSSGVLLHELVSPISDSGGNFGGSIAGIPDVNGDDVWDVAVGAYDQGLRGRAYIFDGRTGMLLQELDSPSIQRETRFGISVGGIPDLNGDGRGDVIVGAYWDSPPGQNLGGIYHRAGRAYIFDGSSGSLIHSLAPPVDDAQIRFGFSVAGLEDINEDGYGDVVVGMAVGFRRRGAVHVFDGFTGDLLQSVHSPGQLSDGEFGNRVSQVPDTHGDGVMDVVVGAYQETIGDGPPDSGAAYILSGPFQRPRLKVSEEALDFGAQHRDDGPTEPRLVRVENEGEGFLEFFEIGFEIFGDQSRDFQLLNLPGLASLAGGESVEFEVAFDPTDSGTREATLWIHTNDSYYDPYEIDLKGVGLPIIPTPTPTSTRTPTPTNTATPTPTDCDSGYYVLDSLGGRHRVGTPPLITGPIYFGTPLARDMEVTFSNRANVPDRNELAVLDGYGSVHYVKFPEIAPDQLFFFTPSEMFPTGRAVDLEITRDGQGFWVLTDFGGIFRAGTAIPEGEFPQVPGTMDLSFLGVDVPMTGAGRLDGFPDPGGASLRAVALVVIQPRLYYSVTGYLVFDSQGGRYHLKPDGTEYEAGFFDRVPENHPNKLLDPAAYAWPFFPGLDILRDVELEPIQENGVILFDGWGGIHPVPVADEDNPVYFANNRASNSNPSPVYTRGMPYLLGGYDDPMTEVDESNSDPSEPDAIGRDVASIFTDLEFSFCAGGFYTLDRFGGVFAFGTARGDEDIVTAPFSGSPYFFPNKLAIDMEFFPTDETCYVPLLGPGGCPGSSGSYGGEYGMGGPYGGYD